MKHNLRCVLGTHQGVFGKHTKRCVLIHSSMCVVLKTKKVCCSNTPYLRVCQLSANKGLLGIVLLFHDFVYLTLIVICTLLTNEG